MLVPLAPLPWSEMVDWPGHGQGQRPGGADQGRGCLALAIWAAVTITASALTIASSLL